MNKGILNLFRSNRYLGSFMTYLLGGILLHGLSILVTPVYTRILSVEGYGIDSVFRTWVAFFAIFIGLQVTGSIATARIHDEIDDFESYLKNITLLSLVGLLVISVLVYLFKDYIISVLEIPSNLLIQLIIQAYGVSCATLYSTYTIHTKQPKANIVFSIIVSLSSIILGLTLTLRFNLDYVGKIYGFTLTYIGVIIFVLFRFLYKKTFFRIYDWKYSLVFGLPLVIHLLSNVVIGQSDRLIIDNYLGKTYVAIYSVAYTIGNLGLIFAEITNKIWAPWYLENTKSQNINIINKVAKSYSLIISHIFVSGMLVAPEILKIMAPKEYWIGINSLIIVSIGIYFQFMYRFPLGYEQYSKRMIWVSINTIISALINVGLNIILIDLYGMIGAAIATLISYVVLFLLHEFVARVIIKNYNIAFKTYSLGIILCLLFGSISILLVNYYIFRYIIVIISNSFLILYLLKNKNNILKGETTK